MLESLIRDGVLDDLKLRGAFLTIDRLDFVPEDSRAQAYLNEALPLGYGATLSQPWTIAFMLNLLEPQTGDHVLDVGSGSGYQTALLAYLVNYEDQRRKGKVIGLELVPDLARQSLRNLAKYNFIRHRVVEIHSLNAVHGYPAAAPFDKIISAAAVKNIPQAWKDQLKEGGRIVAPIGNEIVRLTKTGPNQFTEERFPGFAFVPFQEE